MLLLSLKVSKGKKYLNSVDLSAMEKNNTKCLKQAKFV